MYNSVVLVMSMLYDTVHTVKLQYTDNVYTKWKLQSSYYDKMYTYLSLAAVKWQLSNQVLNCSVVHCLSKSTLFLLEVSCLTVPNEEECY